MLWAWSLYTTSFVLVVATLSTTVAPAADSLAGCVAKLGHDGTSTTSEEDSMVEDVSFLQVSVRGRFPSTVKTTLEVTPHVSNNPENETKDGDIRKKKIAVHAASLANGTAQAPVGSLTAHRVSAEVGGLATGASNATHQISRRVLAFLSRPEISALWNPHLLLYTGHTLAALFGAFMSLRYPKWLMAIILSTGGVFAISALVGKRVLGAAPGQLLWWREFANWFLVDCCCSLPVLALRAYPVKQGHIQGVGWFLLLMLAVNMLWSLAEQSDGHIVRRMNNVTSVVLAMTLPLRGLALWRQDRKIAEMKEGLFLFYAAPLSWLVSYTVWKAIFMSTAATDSIRLGPASTLEVTLLWVLMLFYRKADHTQKMSPIELHFGFARAIQLGIYTAFGLVVGTFVPFIYESKGPFEIEPLKIDNAYFLFIVTVNLIWALCCLIWGVQDALFWRKTPSDVH